MLLLLQNNNHFLEKPFSKVKSINFSIPTFGREDAHFADNVSIRVPGETDYY